MPTAANARGAAETRPLTRKQIQARLNAAVNELNKLNVAIVGAQRKLEGIRDQITSLIGRLPPGDTPTGSNPGAAKVHG